MNKDERLKYLLSKHQEPDVIGELPVTDLDIKDELTLNEGYQEFQRESSKEYLTSDEN